jgi:class 3 adenylate cyclase
VAGRTIAPGPTVFPCASLPPVMLGPPQMSRLPIDIRYATASDGIQVAFTTVGRGAPLVVMPEPVLLAMQADFTHPSPRNWYERLARDRMVVRYDSRGSGLSHVEVAEYSMPTAQRDLQAVVDTLGLMSFDLMGHEDASQVAVAFAVAHPERVRRLILWDGFGASRQLPESASLQTMEHLIDKNWKLWVELLVQSIFTWKGPEAILYAETLAESVPGANALAFLSAAWNWDVTELLPRVTCPTLVLHRRDQVFFPLRLGMALAGAIKGSRLSIVEGASSLPWAGDAETCASIIDDFLGEAKARPRTARKKHEGGRALATVLFTDIVGSTRKATELGDRRWRALLKSHDDMTRRELARFGGHEIKQVGDGFLATFDRPESAVRCACAVVQSVESLGLQVRAGVHTGEVEVDGADVRGIAVHIGARVSALASPGEVLATRTVVDLAAGSGVRFVDRGEHELSGVSGTWTLHAVQSAD